MFDAAFGLQPGKLERSRLHHGSRAPCKDAGRPRCGHRPHGSVVVRFSRAEHSTKVAGCRVAWTVLHDLRSVQGGREGFRARSEERADLLVRMPHRRWRERRERELRRRLGVPANPGGTRRVEQNLLVEAPNLAAWYSRGRMFARELTGDCAHATRTLSPPLSVESMRQIQ